MELVRKGAAKTNQDFFLPREKERKFHEHILSLASPSTLFFYTSSTYSPLNSSNSNSFFFIVHCSFLILNQVGKTVRGEPIDARNFRLPQLLHHHFSSSFILLSHSTDRVGWDKEGGRGQKLNRWDGWEWKGQTLALAKSNKQQ